MPKKDEPENAMVVADRFRFEQRDSKGRLIAYSGMGRLEFLLRKFWRKVQNFIERI